MKKVIIKISSLIIGSLIIAYMVKNNSNYLYTDIFFVLGLVLLAFGVMNIAYEPNRVRSSRGITPTGHGPSLDLYTQQLDEDSNKKRVVGKFSMYNVIILVPSIVMFVLSRLLQ